MQLVLIAHRSSTAFEIAHVGIIVGHDERALELTGVAGIDAEVAAEFHRASYTLWYVYERAVGEHRRVQGGKEIVTIGNDST